MLILCISSAEARRMRADNQPTNEQNQYELMKRPESMPQPPVKTPPQSQRVWQPQVNDFSSWQQLSKPSRDFEYSKFVIDIKTNKIYFVDANVFTLHSDFVLDYLLKIPRTAANIKQYNRNYSSKKPSFILGYLTHYPQIKSNGLGEWTFSFWEGDTIDAPTILKTAKKLADTFKVAPLKFRPDSSYQERVAFGLKKYRIPVIKNSQIYQAMPFQAFNVGEAIGKLNIVPLSQKIENLQFTEDEIVLLQQSYPDISPVAGVITTQFSTPLSHVNLRASAWGIPNAGIKNVSGESTLNTFKHLNGKYVFYQVTEAGFSLREATADEITLHNNSKKEKTQVVMPAADLQNAKLAPLSEISANDAVKYGAKTANLGEMKRANLPLSVPDGVGAALLIPDGFGIPFYYYIQHIQAHGIDVKIAAMLKDKRFSKDAAWRKQSLGGIRQAIQSTPLDVVTLEGISRKWQIQLKGAGVFVRSSTNAEDLKGFNGAGLYDTIPNVKDYVALEAAIKQVWASLWNLRAVEERNHFGISHQQVYSAVLIQTAVNATAAGVLLTTDIWGHQPSTYTINAKWGLGMRVVEGQKVPEQILFDISNDGTRVISRSDETTMLVADAKGGMIERPVPKGDAILTEMRAKKLAQAARRVSQIFNQTEVLDIEWVLESKNGKDLIWIVQARPYVIKSNN